jgi:uncharacterized DUF497 family protein
LRLTREVRLYRFVCTIVKRVTFEWDEAKSEWTKEHRGFDFELAATVFLDSRRIEGRGKGRDGEARFYVIGEAVFGEILFVVYTWRHYENEGTNCRIVSARKAHRSERKRYTTIHEI